MHSTPQKGVIGSDWKLTTPQKGVIGSKWKLLPITSNYSPKERSFGE